MNSDEELRQVLTDLDLEDAISDLTVGDAFATAYPDGSLRQPELIALGGKSAIDDQQDETTRLDQPTRASQRPVGSLRSWLLVPAAAAVVLVVMLIATNIGSNKKQSEIVVAAPGPTQEAVAAEASPIPRLTAVPTSTPAPSGSGLEYTPVVDPYVCEGLHVTAEVVGRISGFETDELVQFEWEGQTSTPRAATEGVREIRWDCNPSQARVVNITGTGLSSGRSLEVQLNTIAVDPTVNTLIDPVVCDGEQEDAPVVAIASGFDSEADGQLAEDVEVSWTDVNGNAAIVLLSSDEEGNVHIEWDCSREQARTVELTLVGQTSGQVLTFELTTVVPSG